MHQSLSDFISENNPDAVKFDNLDAAIIGVGNQYTKNSIVGVLSEENHALLDEIYDLR